MQPNRIYERVRVGESCTARGRSGAAVGRGPERRWAHLEGPRPLLPPQVAASPPSPRQGAEPRGAGFRGPADVKERGASARPRP